MGSICVDDGHTLTSKYPPITVPNLGKQSAVELILSKVQENLDKGRTKWLTDAITGEEIRLDQIEPFTRSVASALVKRGMKKGDVAFYMTNNVTRIYTVILGIWRAGGISHTSYLEDTPELLLERLQSTKASWVFCDSASVALWKPATFQVEWPVEIFVFDEPPYGTTSVGELFLDDGSACPEKSPNPGAEEPIMIYCSSGTTGVSKTTMYSNRALSYIMLGIPSIPWRERPMMFLNRCLNTTGINFTLHSLCQGQSAVMLSNITRENALKAVEKYKPFYVFGYQRYIRFFTDDDAHLYDRSSIEYINCGGTVISDYFHDLLQTLPNLKHTIIGFGLTECAFVAMGVDVGQPDDFQPYPGQPRGPTIGKPMRNTSVRIQDLETGVALGPNKPGELVVKSDFMSSGYWKKPNMTAEFYPNGWYKTGDLAYYDENGFLFILERIKETFVSATGHRICPAELENEILRHPAVYETALFAIECQKAGGLIPRAIVQLKPEAKATPEEILKFVDDHLPEHKHISGGIFLVPGIPRTSSGKMSRWLASKLKLTDESGEK